MDVRKLNLFFQIRVNDGESAAMSLGLMKVRYLLKLSWAKPV